MTIVISTKNIKTTAASRLAFEDLKVGDLVSELNTAAEEFAARSEDLRSAKEEYQHVQGAVTESTNDITRRVTESYYASEVKHTQAELDRQIKAALASDPDHQIAENKVYNAKLDLDEKQHEFDAAKIRHRTLTSQANLVGSTLNFLSASKTARSAHLAALAEV